MAEATTGNDLAGTTQSTGIISRISTSISNVRRMTADPAVQKSIPLMFGVIVAFAKATITPNINGIDFCTAGSAVILLTFEIDVEILLIIPVL